MKNVGWGTHDATRNLNVSLDSLQDSLLNKYHEGKFPAIKFDFKWDAGFDITVLQVPRRGQEISGVARPPTALSVLPH